MSLEFESVNHSFQEVSQDRELQHQSQSDNSCELSDRELEAVAGGGSGKKCDDDDGFFEKFGCAIDRMFSFGKK
ncbi:hypothetical protein QUA20_29145 [Microcoleus sp. Pol7_A1]|uniref:hypothetical protein n=1 Tax=Microcoleus sp. Pol7_A1 TaxID=2818893 RepID=UPI002FD65215